MLTPEHRRIHEKNPMSLYSVIKTIKGHQYLYRQRTYRVGGKVRTENQCVSVFGDDGNSAGLNITGFDGPEARLINIADNTESIPLHSSLQIDPVVQLREDLSMTALVKEEERVRVLMEERGIDTTELKPIRMKIGDNVSTAIGASENRPAPCSLAGYSVHTCHSLIENNLSWAVDADSIQCMVSISKISLSIE